jgi:hypothetical protein
MQQKYTRSATIYLFYKQFITSKIIFTKCPKNIFFATISAYRTKNIAKKKKYLQVINIT